MFKAFFDIVRPQCRVENFYATGKQKSAYSFDCFCEHLYTVVETMGSYDIFCLCQEAWTSPTAKETQRGIEKRELHKLQKQ